MTPFSLRLFHLLVTYILFTVGALQFVHALPSGQATEMPKAEGAADTDRALLSTITFPDDMVGTVFAREPNVQDPTAISIDEKTGCTSPRHIVSPAA